MVPQNANWAELIEKCYGDKAKKVTRYAIKKEMDIFDVENLQQSVDSLQSGYALKKMEEAEYNMCKENTWAKLILECLEEGLYPSWDAQNKWSVALAEKLGYHFSHEYVAYEIMGY